MGMTLTEEIIQAALVAPDDRKAEALRMLKGEAPPPPARPATTGPLLLSMGVASELLGISRVTMWRVLRAGKIKRVEIFPGAYRVTREDVESLAAGKVGTSEFPRKRGRPRKEGARREDRSQESEFRRQEVEGADGAEKGSGFGVQAGAGGL
jgi:hypothetical protein